MMKILYVLEYYPPYTGGSEVLFGNITREMAQKNHIIRVITTRHDHSLPKKEIVGNLEIIRLSLNNRFLFTFCSLPFILWYGKGFDLIHTTTYNAALPAYFASKLSRKKIVITFHEVIGENWFKFPWLSKFKAMCFNAYEKLVLSLNFDKYIAVSDHTKQSLLLSGILTDKIVRIYNGVDYKDYSRHTHSPVNNSFTYGFFGRLGHSKGIDILLTASKLFYELSPDFKLILIIPKTPKKLYNKILNDIDIKGLSNNIEIKSDLSRNELYETLCSLHCVVVPSYNEGFCFAAVETIGLGIPIIASYNSALKEVISGKHLFLYNNDANDLFQQLIKAKEGDFIVDNIKQFHLTDSINKYHDFYNNDIKQ